MSTECFPARIPLSVSFFRVLTVLPVEFFYFHALIYCEVFVFLKAIGNGAVSLISFPVCHWYLGRVLFFEC